MQFVGGDEVLVECGVHGAHGAITWQMKGEVSQRASHGCDPQTSDLQNVISTQMPEVERDARDLMTFTSRRQYEVDDALVGVRTCDPKESSSAP